MALQQCLECGKEVSSMAKICPHCGAPYKKVKVVEPMLPIVSLEQTILSKKQASFIAQISLVLLLGGVILSSSYVVSLLGGVLFFGGGGLLFLTLIQIGASNIGRNFGIILGTAKERIQISFLIFFLLNTATIFINASFNGSMPIVIAFLLSFALWGCGLLFISGLISWATIKDQSKSRQVVEPPKIGILGLSHEIPCKSCKKLLPLGTSKCPFCGVFAPLAPWWLQIIFGLVFFVLFLLLSKS